MPHEPPSSPLVRFVALCLVMTIGTAGCTSMRPVRGINAPSAPQEFANIKPGDRVDVEMKDGRQERFQVQSINGDALVSPSGQRYARTEMVQLRRQQLSHAKTWPLVGVAVFFGAVLISAIAYYN